MDTIYNIQTIKVRLKVSEPPGRKKTLDGDRVISYLRGIYRKLDEDQEHFTILCLDQKNRVTGYKVLFSGGTTQTTVDPKIIFRTALLMGAVKLVICHNHPGGDSRPSPDDEQLTARLESLGDQLCLKVVDHIILGDRTAWSLARSKAIDDFLTELRENRARGVRRTRRLRRRARGHAEARRLARWS
ncbi:MAG TPA: JAB domain-containing protein [Candidatus Binatia bacterium]|jgi:DNA repair protein RadC